MAFKTSHVSFLISAEQPNCTGYTTPSSCDSEIIQYKLIYNYFKLNIASSSIWKLYVC